MMSTQSGNDIQREIYRNTGTVLQEKGKQAGLSWRTAAEEIRSGIALLLTDEYLKDHRRQIRYTAVNPWRIPPAPGISDWLLSSRSKHIMVQD